MRDSLREPSLERQQPFSGQSGDAIVKGGEVGRFWQTRADDGLPLSEGEVVHLLEQPEGENEVIRIARRTSASSSWRRVLLREPLGELDEGLERCFGAGWVVFRSFLAHVTEYTS